MIFDFGLLEGDLQLLGYRPSPDGSLLACRLATDDEQETICFVEVATGNLLDDIIEHSSGSDPCWNESGTAIFYTSEPRYKSKLEWSGRSQNPFTVPPWGIDLEIVMHPVGEADEICIFSMQADGGLEEAAMPKIQISSGRMLIQLAAVDSIRGVFTKQVEDLLDPTKDWLRVGGPRDQLIDAVLHGGEIFVATWRNSSRGEVVRLDADAPTMAKAQPFFSLPSTEPGVIPKDIYPVMTAANDALYVLKKGLTEDDLWRVPFDGQPPEKLKFPVEGMVDEVVPGPSGEGVSFSLRPLTAPPLRGQFSPQEGLSLQQPVHPLAGAAYHHRLYRGLNSKVVYARSNDGTLIPVTLLYRGTLKPDGSRRLLLKGYQAYGAWIDQWGGMNTFSDEELLLAQDNDVLLAVAHGRGGGELGRDWQLAAKGSTRKGAERDFLAVAYMLTTQGYTSTRRLGVSFASAGALLLNAVLRSPALFAVVLIEAGLFDPTKTSGNSEFNIREFGFSADEEIIEGLWDNKLFTRFMMIRDMNPRFQIPPDAKLPATYLISGLKDRRTPYQEALRLAAELQYKTTGDRPIVLHTLAESGHRAAYQAVRQDNPRLQAHAFFLEQTAG